MFLDNVDKKMPHKSLRCEERVTTIPGGMDEGDAVGQKFQRPGATTSNNKCLKPI